MIADDIRYSSLLYLTFHTDQVIESLISFGCSRCFVFRQHTYKLVSYQQRINHLSFSITRMYISTLYMYLGSSCIEVFKLQFTYFTSIHCICPFTSEFFYIKLMCSQSDFFIRIEAYANFSVFYFRMFFQICHSSNDFGNTSLIISSQQCTAVGYNQILSYMIEQFWKLLGRKNDSLFLTQCNILASIITDDIRIYIFSRHVGAGIHMSYETDCRYISIYICRKSGKQITIVIQRDFLQSQCLKFCFQIFGKNHLFGRTRSYTG